MFRRLKRKILPRRTSQRISNAFSRVAGVFFLVAGLLILVWGVVLNIKPSLASSLPANALTNKITTPVIGLALTLLGFSLSRMYRLSQGEIETQFLKKGKKKDG